MSSLISLLRTLFNPHTREAKTIWQSREKGKKNNKKGKQQ